LDPGSPALEASTLIQSGAIIHRIVVICVLLRCLQGIDVVSRSVVRQRANGIWDSYAIPE